MTVAACRPIGARTPVNTAGGHPRSRITEGGRAHVPYARRSVALHQVRPVGGRLIGLGPEVGYPGDPAVVAEVEEAQPGLLAVPAGEPPDPARRVLALTDGPLHGDM